MLLPFPRQAFERVRERRLEPFLPADSALEAKQVRVGPAAASHHGGDGFLYVALIWVAARDKAERQAVRAENKLHFAAILIENQSKQEWAVDGWQLASGKPPEIVEREKWYIDDSSIVFGGQGSGKGTQPN